MNTAGNFQQTAAGTEQGIRKGNTRIPGKASGYNQGKQIEQISYNEICAQYGDALNTGVDGRIQTF